MVARALASREQKPGRTRQLSSEQVAGQELLGSGPAMQEVFKRIALVAAERLLGADHRRERHRQGTRGPGDPSPFESREKSHSSRSTWPRSARRWSRANYSATPREPLPAPTRRGRACWSWPTRPPRFFDEAGDIPPSVQVKLLRVLEQHEVTPVGETQPRASDFRTIAATNRELRRDFHSGDFRQDLYFRLAVFEIHLPPLRERLEDVPLLAERFLSRLAQPGESAKRFTAGGHDRALPAALARQRSRTAQRSRARGPVGPLGRNRPRAFAATIAARIERVRPHRAAFWSRPCAIGRLPSWPRAAVPAACISNFSSQAEPPLFETVLDSTLQNRAAAADLLGIHRATLRKKLN